MHATKIFFYFLDVNGKAYHVVFVVKQNEVGNAKIALFPVRSLKGEMSDLFTSYLSAIY